MSTNPNLYTNPAPLAATVDGLRTGQHSLSLYLDEMAARMDSFEPLVQALLPEPDRWARLRAEAAALRQRFPDPATRPPLYGLLVGVKDIFHVNSFVTRAGSQVPPELFAAPKEHPEATCVTQLR
ncbi:MAG: amidase family protein, partial [Chloroflexota bacterium]|nr:amidase family protein [Chloroflexota bacterium]